jgi:hypothetical protein
MMQFDEIGIAIFRATKILEAMFKANISTRSSSRNRGITDVTPYGRPIYHVVDPDDAVDKTYQAR